MIVGEIYNTNSSGLAEIIKDLGVENKHRHVLIRFLNTNNTKVVRYDGLKSGLVSDDKHIRSIRDLTGKTFHSLQYGDFIVECALDYFIGHNRAYKIKFIDTGYELVTNRTNILSGRVKDPYCKKIHGVGYLGNATKINDKASYDTWLNMLSRVYSTNNNYDITYADVTVDPKWHSFENFARDVKKLPGYEEYIDNMGDRSHALDKDLLQGCLPDDMHKVYSPETCCFIPTSMNSHMANGFVNEYISNQVGIYTDGVKYYVRPIFNNQVYDLGEYTSYEAACNVYNNRCIFYGYNDMIIPNVPYMTPEQIQQHKIRGAEIIRNN